MEQTLTKIEVNQSFEFEIVCSLDDLLENNIEGLNEMVEEKFWVMEDVKKYKENHPGENLYLSDISYKMLKVNKENDVVILVRAESVETD